MATQLKPRAIPVTRKRSVEWRYGRALSALRECVAITRDELARDVALAALKDCGASSVVKSTGNHVAAQDNQKPNSSSSATLSVTEGGKSCAACPIDEGVCPICNTLWERRGEERIGYRFGVLRPAGYFADCYDRATVVEDNALARSIVRTRPHNLSPKQRLIRCWLGLILAVSIYTAVLAGVGRLGSSFANHLVAGTVTALLMFVTDRLCAYYDPPGFLGMTVGDAVKVVRKWLKSVKAPSGPKRKEVR